MKKMDRREFVARTLMGAGAVWAGHSRNPSLLAANPVKKQATDRVLLGTTGIKLSRLAMGSGTNGVNPPLTKAVWESKDFPTCFVTGLTRELTFGKPLTSMEPMNI